MATPRVCFSGYGAAPANEDTAHAYFAAAEGARPRLPRAPRRGPLLFADARRPRRFATAALRADGFLRHDLTRLSLRGVPSDALYLCSISIRQMSQRLLPRPRPLLRADAIFDIAERRSPCC